MADAPRVGQVVDHFFLWVEEQAAGQVEGRKARPCLIVAVEPLLRVTVLPMTSRAPRLRSNAMAVPDNVKRHAGLATDRSVWLVIDEANIFSWPGFDLVPQRDGGFVRGVVTRGFFHQVREAVLSLHAAGGSRAVERDDE